LLAAATTTPTAAALTGRAGMGWLVMLRLLVSSCPFRAKTQSIKLAVDLEHCQAANEDINDENAVQAHMKIADLAW